MEKVKKGWPGKQAPVGLVELDQSPLLLYSATVALGDQTGKQRSFPQNFPHPSNFTVRGLVAHHVAVATTKEPHHCCQLSGKQQTTLFKVLSGVDNGCG